MANPGAIRRDYADDALEYPTYAESAAAEPTYSARGVDPHIPPTMEAR